MSLIELSADGPVRGVPTFAAAGPPAETPKAGKARTATGESQRLTATGRDAVLTRIWQHAQHGIRSAAQDEIL